MRTAYVRIIYWSECIVILDFYVPYRLRNKNNRDTQTFFQSNPYPDKMSPQIFYTDIKISVVQIFELTVMIARSILCNLRLPSLCG